ncbi:hypothetical protein ACGFZP_33420 [Kitasatospora sp. NPDC048239]|uniref:hypothetical protein n=1 Tax=Kitasatospora sp. NPDC048239 TaxID=3364046 RepID=UPI00371DED68
MPRRERRRRGEGEPAGLECGRQKRPGEAGDRVDLAPVLRQACAQLALAGEELAGLLLGVGAHLPCPGSTRGTGRPGPPAVGAERVAEDGGAVAPHHTEVVHQALLFHGLDAVQHRGQAAVVPVDGGEPAGRVPLRPASA